MPEADSVKKLTEDKKKLEEKIKTMSKLLEMSLAKKTQSPVQQKTGYERDLEAYIGQLKKSIRSLGKKIDKPSKDEQAKMESMLIDQIRSIEDKLSIVSKIPEIENRIIKMEQMKTEKPEQEAEKPPGLFGGFTADFVDTHKMESTFKEYQDAIQSKFVKIEDAINAINSRFNAKTIEEWEDMVASSTEIVNQIIPAKVRSEVDKILSVFSTDLGKISLALKELADDTVKLNRMVYSSIEDFRLMKERLDKVEDKMDDLKKEIIRILGSK